METINNAASAASRAIWGNSNTNNGQSNESGNEPISGQTGNTSSGEPYDAGNSDPTNIDRAAVAGNTDTTNASTSGVSRSGPKITDGPGNTPTTAAIRPEHDTDKTGVTSANQPSSKFGDEKLSNANDSSGPGPEPSVGADPASGAQDTQKYQAADRPEDTPNSDEHSRIQEAKKEAEDAQNVDTSGPSPQTLPETHKSGGGAQQSSSSDGGEDGPQKVSHDEGTGEKYVKSSGMKSDGGDFDASAAGAGKEADRLLEAKGIHHEVGAAGAPADDKSDPLKEKINKPSLGERIKAKLHKS